MDDEKLESYLDDYDWEGEPDTIPVWIMLLPVVVFGAAAAFIVPLVTTAMGWVLEAP